RDSSSRRSAAKASSPSSPRTRGRPPRATSPAVIGATATRNSTGAPSTSTGSEDRPTRPCSTSTPANAPPPPCPLSPPPPPATPPQDRALLNDPAHVEFAQMLGQRMLKDREALGRPRHLNKPEEDAKRLAYGFRLCTSRRPTDREMEILRKLLDDQRVHFQ